MGHYYQSTHVCYTGHLHSNSYLHRGTENDGKIIAQGSFLGAPWAPKTAPTRTKDIILHKYFACRFYRAAWPALWPKPAQKYMTETVFGLRRRERIACWSFADKIVRGTHFWRILASCWVPNRATWVTSCSKGGAVWPVGSVSLSGLWK
jgi:hypothetical protein